MKEEVLQNLQRFVQQNVVSVQQGRKCVDGRYLPTQSSGMIARPGGDCGYVMALMAVSKKKNLTLTPEQCFTAVYNVIKKYGKFSIHTDHHVDPDEHTQNGLIGCGHLVKASTDILCKEYGVEGKDVEQVVKYARTRSKSDSSMEIVSLDGEHTEKGVLVIKSDSYTVNANDPELKQMYFIYDELRDIAFMKKLVSELAIDGVDFEAMKEASDIQLTATLRNLAMGLPMYSVSFAGTTPTVSYLDIVK